MLEQLLSTLPPVLDDKLTHKRCWLTIGAADNGVWMAAYLDFEGNPVNSLQGNGMSILSAVEDLVDVIRLTDILSRPAVQVDELSGKLDIS